MNFDMPAMSVKMPPLDQLTDLSRLQRQQVRLEGKIEGDVNTALRNRLAETRHRLRACVAHPRAATFNERFLQAIDEIGRERLLLKLYLLDEGESTVRQYLPPFDEAVCNYLLRSEILSNSSGRLRNAASLFFKRFDHLPACATLGQHLQENFAALESNMHTTGRMARWDVHRNWLFAIDGPQALVSHRQTGETLLAAADRTGVPRPSRFFDLAQQHYLFARLRNLPFEQDDEDLFAELIAGRDQMLTNREFIGGHTLQILIQRSLVENHGHLPDAWGKRIPVLGCDPRLSRRSEAFCRWWAWANEAELAVALRWFTGEELDKFLYLLESSLGPAGRQKFERRKAVLLKLFKANKISDARLAVVDDAMRDAKRHFQAQLGSFASLSGRHISIICLRVENFYIVEGTHGFALRLYRKFPVNGFWERTRSEFRIDEFMRGSDQPPIPKINHQGNDWELRFENALMYYFHFR